MNILAIDPGPGRSAFLALNEDAIGDHGIVANIDLLRDIRSFVEEPSVRFDRIVIEKVEGFGMAVGAEVFETVYWSGMFAEAANPLPVYRIGRKAIKIHLCGTTKAKDPNIRQALLDRFPAGKGTKASPGPLYGISADLWSALAVAVTFADGVR